MIVLAMKISALIFTKLKPDAYPGDQNHADADMWIRNTAIISVSFTYRVVVIQPSTIPCHLI